MTEQEKQAAERALESREAKATPPPGMQPTQPPPPPPAEEPPLRSLGMVSHMRDPQDTEPAIPHGYIELDATAFPSQGLFYPAGARFFIKAASVADVRHFSTVNENDPFAVAESFNSILKNSLHVRGLGNRAMFTYKDVLDEDRIHIIMAIREATFVHGENRLVVSCKCESCQTDNSIELRNEAFERVDVDPKIMKYYSDEERCFVIPTRSLGEVRIAPPTVGVMAEVTRSIRERQREGKELDLSFVKILPYISGGWKGFNEPKIKALETDILGWSLRKWEIMNGLVDKVRVGVKETLHAECVGCKARIETPVTFPGGVKALFVVSDISEELL